MAKTDNLTDFLTGVAEAIRTKKGTTAKINPQNFETEISSITTPKPEQEKTTTPTNVQQTILPDNGKTLSKVVINSAPLPSSFNQTYKDVGGVSCCEKHKNIAPGLRKQYHTFRWQCNFYRSFCIRVVHQSYKHNDTEQCNFYR